MNDLRIYQQYNRLVRRGYVKPLQCKSCAVDYILRATYDGDPVLWCMSCDSRTQPGLALTDQVRSVVKEHFG